MVQKYNQRRKALVAGLKELGFGIQVEPTGAFYVFARCGFLDQDDYKLAFDIIEKCGVACTPGRDFGPGGHGYLRFSYASSLENIKEGHPAAGRNTSRSARHNLELYHQISGIHHLGGSSREAIPSPGRPRWPLRAAPTWASPP
jgi:hypothetical protein